MSKAYGEYDQAHEIIQWANGILSLLEITDWGPLIMEQVLIHIRFLMRAGSYEEFINALLDLRDGRLPSVFTDEGVVIRPEEKEMLLTLAYLIDFPALITDTLNLHMERMVNEDNRSAIEAILSEALQIWHDITN